jgi:hypothetical protein
LGKGWRVLERVDERKRVGRAFRRAIVKGLVEKERRKKLKKERARVQAAGMDGGGVVEREHGDSAGDSVEVEPDVLEEGGARGDTSGGSVDTGGVGEHQVSDAECERV